MLDSVLTGLNGQMQQLTHAVGNMYTKFLTPSAHTYSAPAASALDAAPAQQFTSAIQSTVQGDAAKANQETQLQLQEAATQLSAAKLANTEAAMRTANSLKAAEMALQHGLPGAEAAATVLKGMDKASTAATVAAAKEGEQQAAVEAIMSP